MENRKMMKGQRKDTSLRTRIWTEFIIAVLASVILLVIVGRISVRLDLTEDKRYTLSEPTRIILSDLKEDIFVQVYLDGEIPIPLKRLRRSVMETLEEFRIGSGRKIDYEFINPADATDQTDREAQYAALIEKGLTPVNIINKDSEGGSSRKMIFPGLIINCNGVEIPVDILENNQYISYEQNILHSIEGLEYEIIQTIATITSDTIHKIAFIEGQGEYSDLDVADITKNLAKYFTIDRGAIKGRQGALDKYSAIIIAGPSSEFNEADKLIVDQYIMNGGKVLWLVEEVNVNTDSLAMGETLGLYKQLNIEDQLFRYGARINPELLQDLDCMVIPMTVRTGPENTQVIRAPWPYYPRLNPSGDHPVTRNINKVMGRFVNSVDTVGLDPAIKKTILLTTSGLSRKLSPPLLIRLKEAENMPDEKEFGSSAVPVALLLEGEFPSAFRNRMISSQLSSGREFRSSSVNTRMIVVADADIIRNDIQVSASGTGYFPLSKERFTGEIIGNRDFIVNCINYLVDYNGLMDLRSREVRLSLLDKQKIKKSGLLWQIINIAGPLLLVAISGILYNIVRRRRFTITEK